MRIWKPGEKCRATCQGSSVVATVVLASSNGRSLAIEFDAILAGYAGLMLLLWKGDGFSVIAGPEEVPVKLEELD